MTVNIFGYEFEHIASTRAVGDPVVAYVVVMEDGWCIKPPQLVNTNTYKTATALYSTTDLSLTVIIPISELPEGATISNVTPPVVTE